jgi:hypothetical protein
MLFLQNNGYGQVKMNYIVNGVLWNDIIAPRGKSGDTLEIPSLAHKSTIIPYLKMLNLSLIEDDVTINPPERITEPNLTVDTPMPSRIISEVETLDRNKDLEDLMKTIYDTSYETKKPEEVVLKNENDSDSREPEVEKIIEELSLDIINSLYGQELSMETRAELKEQCRNFHLDDSGKKDDLIFRLVNRKMEEDRLTNMK